MTFFGTYSAPTIEEGDQYKPKEHYGNSVVVKVNELKPSLVTKNSPDGAPAVICDLVDLNKKQVYRNVLMMTGAIVDGLRPHVGTGKPVVVKWEKRESKSGRDYAFPGAASPEAVAAAEKWWSEKGDPFAQEFATVTEEAPF